MLKQVTILSTTSQNEHRAAERATEQVNQWLAEYDTVRVLSIRVAPVVHTHSRKTARAGTRSIPFLRPLNGTKGGAND